MEYSKIIAVSGLPGLFEMISSKTDGAIVRSLEDKNTRFISSRIHQFSHLETIEIYTKQDNVNLAEVLKAMKASAEKLPDEKDGAALKKYFEKVFADIDFERVYSSDLKKMVKWFSILDKNQVEIKISEPEEETPAEEIALEPTPQKKPRPKAAKEEEEPEVKTIEKQAAKEKAKAKPATKAKEKAKEKETAQGKAKTATAKKKEKK